jgi:hypothetical protein
MRSLFRRHARSPTLYDGYLAEPAIYSHTESQ